MPYRLKDNVTEFLKKTVLKVTGEKIDGDEINEYIAMSLDYLDACSDLFFNEKEFFKWLKYKVISIVYLGKGLNEGLGHNGQVIRRGLKSFDSKVSKALLKKGDIYEKKCSKLEEFFKKRGNYLKELKTVNDDNIKVQKNKLNKAL